MKSLIGIVLLFPVLAVAEPAPTYFQDVAPLIGAKCLSCHGQTPQGAPFSLNDYNAVKAHASGIKRATLSRTMPPFLVDNSGSCNTFNNITWLSDQEISMIGRWVDSGSPAGDESKATPVPAPELNSRLNRIDARTEMKESYQPVGPNDEYRCFVVDAPVSESKFLTGYNVLPGNLDVVHHVVIYQPTARGQMRAEELDAQDDKPGYECFGGPGTEAEPLAVWAPGAGATLMPKGTGLEVVGGRKLVMQVHYSLHHTHGGKIEPDLSKIEFQLENDVLNKADFTLFGKISDGEIPAGEKAYTYTMTIPVEANTPHAFQPFTLYGVFPHMHLYGTNIQLEVIRHQESAKACMMNVPRWNFHRQFSYFYGQPIDVEAGDQVVLKCTYNTMSTQTPVKFGEFTSDEMCVMGLFMVPRVL
jgi:hypothetical protein